jgi:hypothetical protein
MGPGELIPTAMATSSIGIEKMMNANSETQKSKILFCILIIQKNENSMKNKFTILSHNFPIHFLLLPFT